MTVGAKREGDLQFLALDGLRSRLVRSLGSGTPQESPPACDWRGRRVGVDCAPRRDASAPPVCHRGATPVTPRCGTSPTSEHMLSPLRSPMFFTYLWRELRRRARQAIFIAVGLALGIGLVITVTAASAGVKNAQSTVLHSLYGVGTDITVTKAPTAGPAGTAGSGSASGRAPAPTSGPQPAARSTTTR